MSKRSSSFWKSNDPTWIKEILKKCWSEENKNRFLSWETADFRKSADYQRHAINLKHLLQTLQSLDLKVEVRELWYNTYPLADLDQD